MRIFAYLVVLLAASASPQRNARKRTGKRLKEKREKRGREREISRWLNEKRRFIIGSNCTPLRNHTHNENIDNLNEKMRGERGRKD